MKKLAVICFAVVAGLLSFVTVPAEEIPKEIKGGILNGKATSLPAPEYPSEAKVAGVEASVNVDVVIDESGMVISAVSPGVVRLNSVSSLDEKELASIDQLFRQSAEKAALEARFPPTQLSGIPVKVSGTIVYSFVSDAAGAPVNAGILNGKANSLPKPAYPEAARAVRAAGNVVIRVVIDENGDVITATAVSGHPLLRAVSVESAKAAKFSPTLLSGQPVKVSGMLVYNFFVPPPPKKEETTN